MGHSYASGLRENLIPPWHSIDVRLG